MIKKLLTILLFLKCLDLLLDCIHSFKSLDDSKKELAGGGGFFQEQIYGEDDA
jgi:hypothetical protein